MENEGNYIKLYRSMLKWEWYRNVNTKTVFLHMLLKANWKDAKWEGITIRRGSFVSSIANIARETSLTADEVRTALKHLETTMEVTKQSTNKYTVFTVVNYDRFQETPQANPKQIPSKSQASPKQIPTIEEEKEREEEKEEKEREEINKKKGTSVPKKKSVVYYPNDENLNQAFSDYVQMRKELKKPMTDRAISLAQKKLKELATLPFSDSMDNDIAIQILEQSILHSWQGLFPLKDNSKAAAGNKAGEIDWSKV